MEYEVVEISVNSDYQIAAAEILFNTFYNINSEAWPSLNSAIEEVNECIKNDNVCIGISIKGKIVGWTGLRPMYEKTWELHPMVVEKNWQGQGIGKILISELEKIAKIKGLNGIVLGTDDDSFRTSLSMKELHGENLFKEIMNIKNINNHPYEFYERCGYKIVGIIPNAGGKNKPDIWMWKNIM